MLWSLIYVWNHFMGDALMTRWIPDLEDAALLFGTDGRKRGVGSLHVGQRRDRAYTW